MRKDGFDWRPIRFGCRFTDSTAQRMCCHTGGKDAHVVPRVYGGVGYDVPVAQSAVPLYVHFKFQRMISQVTSRMNIASL